MRMLVFVDPVQIPPLVGQVRPSTNVIKLKFNK